MRTNPKNKNTITRIIDFTDQSILIIANIEDCFAMRLVNRMLTT